MRRGAARPGRGVPGWGLPGVLARLLAVLLLLPTASVAAQAPEPLRSEGDAGDPIAAFNAASGANLRAQRRIGAVRGAPLERSGGMPGRRDGLGFTEVTSLLAEGRGAAFPPGTALLFYRQQGDRLVAWLIGGGGLLGFAAVPVTPGELTSAAANLRLSLGVETLALSRAPRRRGEIVPEYPGRREIEADATRLAALLLPPPLQGPLRAVRHLIIVGDGVVATVPFAMLPVGPRRVLIDEMTITLAPGLGELAEAVAPWQGDELRRAPLVIGNPLVGPSSAWTVPPLPGAEAEARAVAGLFGAQPLLTGAARRDAVEGRLPEASLLYFAAHGIANAERPLDGGGLMLAADTAEAGLLTARAVQAIETRAQLAVLSACQSGLGQLDEGGVIGLARAFRIAGVPRVVMSLWSVSDDATRFMMTRFAAATLTMPPAAALRQAILATRARYPDPIAWAPFLVFGTPR